MTSALHQASAALCEALGLASSQSEVERLVRAWSAFWPSAPWEHVSSELGVPVERVTNGRSTELLVSVVGRSAETVGVVVYDDRADFQRLFTDGTARGLTRSVLAAPDVLADYFRPLGVPAPVLSTNEGLEPRETTSDDVRVLSGALELLLNVVNGERRCELAAGDALVFSAAGAT